MSKRYVYSKSKACRMRTGGHTVGQLTCVQFVYPTAPMALRYLNKVSTKTAPMICKWRVYPSLRGRAQLFLRCLINSSELSVSTSVCHRQSIGREAMQRASAGCQGYAVLKGRASTSARGTYSLHGTIVSPAGSGRGSLREPRHCRVDNNLSGEPSFRDRNIPDLGRDQTIATVRQ
jgi:hypothetical protein